MSSVYQNSSYKIDDESLVTDDGETKNWKYTSKYPSFAIIVTILIFVVSYVWSEHARGGSSFDNFLVFKFKKDEQSESYSWTYYNRNYDPLSTMVNRSSFLAYTFLESYDSIIEPGANMTIYFSDSSFNYFETTVCQLEGKAQHDCETTTGDFVRSCDPFDEFQIQIAAKPDADSEESETVSLSGNALCIYVRREIRSLVADDLNAALDAMATLWTTTEKQGQKQYGNNFHSHTYFTSAHYFGSASLEADYTHGGHGFLPQHAKLSNMFELAMQSVDPSVTLPYWDYSIDAQYDSLSDSFVFSADVFGSLTTPNNSVGYWLYESNDIEDAKIPDGRWANLKVNLNSDYYTENAVATSPYGYLRAPWSANPSKYVLRFPVGTWETAIGSPPGCSAFYDWMFEYDTLSDLLSEADVGPHTKAHWVIGSQFGCDVLDEISEKYPAFVLESKYNLCSEWGIFVKSFFRDGYLETNTSCTASTALDSSTCAWSCVHTESDEFVSALKKNLKSYFSSSSLTSSDWIDMQTFFCAGNAYKLFFGDHREPASPSDPSFWPIHPTTDRALQAKFLSGSVSSMEWGTPVCGSDVTCYGHYEDDGFPDFITGNTSATVGMTNRDYVEYTNPTSTSYAMPYIYDKYSWTHCSSTDYDIDSKLEQVSNKHRLGEKR